MNALPMKSLKRFAPLLVLLLGVIMVPLATLAQCGGPGGGFTGFGGPDIVITGTFTNTGGVLEGEFTDIGYEGDWEPFMEQIRQTVNYDYHGSTFSFLNFFSLPAALAQCGGHQPPSTQVEASLTATPGSINTGQSSVLSWGSENANYCVGDGFSTGGEAQGDVTVSPSETTNYGIMCYAGSSDGIWRPGTIYTVNYQCGAINPNEAMATDFCSNNRSPSGSCSAGDTCKTSTNGMYPAPSSCTSGEMYDEINMYECEAQSSQGTWQHQSTDLTDLACPWTDHNRPYGGMEDCSQADPSGMSCTPGQDTRCKTNTAGGGNQDSCVVETNVYSCESSGDDSASDDAVVTVSGGPLAVSCLANPNPQSIDNSVTWSANASGGEGSYTYAWSGSDGLTGSASSVQKTYSTTGMKSASVLVTSGAQANSVACTALEVEDPVGPECSDGLDNNGTGGTDTDDTEACDGPDDDDEGGAGGSLSCTVDDTNIDVGANTTYHAIGIAGPYTWQPSGQENCSGGANNNCDFPNPGDYSMRVSAPGVGTPKLCPFVKAGCQGSPTVDIKSDKTRVNVKDTVHLTWTASGVMQATCVILGPGVNEIVTPSACMLSDGMQTPPILTQSIYSIDCGEDAKASIIINVTSDQIEF